MTLILVAAPFEEYVLPDALVEAARKKGKGLYTLLMRDDIRQAVLDAGFDLDAGKFRQARASASTKAAKEFEELWTSIQRDISTITQMYLRGRAPKSKARKVPKEEWLDFVRGSLRRGYFSAFEMGLKSSGAEKFRVVMSDADRKYVENAIAQEMVYFNKLLREIDKGTYSGKLHQRLAAYSDAMKHVYYAGRVMGTPTGMIIDWIAPMDRNTCRGCSFLFRHSPYTKKTLPTTPRAGDTPCLNRCRCRLVMRTVSPEEFEKVEGDHETKKVYGMRLAAIKSGKALS